MTLHITNHEITIILQALSSQPYMDVAALIRKIVEQTAKKEEEQ